MSRETPTLWELSEDMRALEALLEEQDEGTLDDADVIARWLEELDGAIADKADRVLCVIQTIEARAGLRRREVQRLSERARIDESKASRLRERLKDLLVAAGHTSLEVTHGRITVRSNPAQPDVDGIDPMLLPEQYRKHVPERWGVDTAALGRALRAGERVMAGEREVTLRPASTSLVIK